MQVVMKPACTLDLSAPSETTFPNLYVRRTLQSLPPVPPDRPNAPLKLQATSLVHAPPATIAAAIKSDLHSLLDTNDAPSEHNEDGQLVLVERTLRIGTTVSGRAVKQTFRIVGNLTQPHATIIEFEPASLESPLFSITLIAAPHDCTQLTMCLALDVSSKPSRETSRPNSTLSILRLNKQFPAPISPGDDIPTLLLPHAHAAVLLADLSTIVTNCHLRYARYAEMDIANANDLVASIDTCPDLTPTETDMIDRHVLADTSTTTADGSSSWRRIKGTVAEPVEYFQKLSDSATSEAAWGKASAIIDASAESVFSYLWNYKSYERMQQHELNEKGRLRKELQLSAHSKIMIGAKNFPGSLDDRVFPAYNVWRIDANGGLDSDIVIAFGDIELSKRPDDIARANAIIEADPRASKSVRGATRGGWRLTPLAPNVCRVSLVQQGEVGGIIPLWILNLRIKSTLSFMDEIRSRSQRNGHVVDAEVRAAFPIPPRLDQLDAHQKLIVANCVALEQGEGVELADWTPIISTSPFAKMWLRFPERRKGERQLSIGRASITIDCSPREALAWWFDFASRERAKKSCEDGDPARLIWTENGPHDNVVATIKNSQFPLHRREFVSRQLCVVDDGVLSWFTSSVDQTVDYGTRKYARAVRARITAVARFKLVVGRADQCELHVVQHVDFAERFPAFILNSKLPSVLAVVSEFRESFEKDDEIDRVERDKLARVIGDEQQAYTAKEDTLINTVHARLLRLEWKDFEELESPDPLVKMGKIFIDGSSSGVGRASVTIDASVEECAAWEMAKMSRENRKEHSAFGGLERDLLPENDHHSIYHIVYDLGIPGFRPREFLLSQIWKLQKDKLVVAYKSLEHVKFPLKPQYVRGTSLAIWEYEKVQQSGNTPQMCATYTCQVDLGGAIPKYFVNRGAVSQLLYLGTMRKRFDNSLEVDAGARTRHVEMIMAHNEVYSVEETKILEDGEKQFAIFNGLKAKQLKMVSPLATAKMAFKSGDRHAWGWASVTVRASPEEVLGFLWDTMRRSARRDDDLEKAVEEKPNGHNQLVYQMKKTPTVIANRDFLGRKIWRTDAEGAFVLVTNFEESANRPVWSISGIGRLLSTGRHSSVTGRTLSGSLSSKYYEKRVVRGKFPSATRIKRVNGKETTLEYVIHPDFGGDVPSFLMNRYTAKNLANVTATQEYFQELRGLEEWDADDGRAVGEVMCIKTKAEKHREKGDTNIETRMGGLFKKHKALKQIAEKYEFFQPMMKRVVENRLRAAIVVDTPLCDVSKKEGGVMARGLAMAMASHLTAEAGVDEWILRYNALKQFDKEEVWFRPMMNVVGKRLLGEVSWGLKMRVMMGAGLSILDLATDIFVIVGYMGKEETKGYGWSLLGMIVACMGMQLFVVFAQNRKTPMKMLRETIIALTGLKPGFDAYNVISGKEADQHSIVDAKSELVAVKGIEMVCESIPGCLLQLFVILKSGERSRRALASVAVSALTTGFISASISFDYDVDPQKRKEAPEFYGYIPDDGKRTAIFCAMVLNSALLLLVRSLSAAMLMLAKKRYFAVYMAGDMALYLLQKVVRGDLHYWIPVAGAWGLLASLVARVLVKTITDFTGVINFRHSYELGGLYWTGNMFLALLTSFASVWIYFEQDRVEVKKREAWTLVGYMSGAWLTIFGLFLLLMKKEYRLTFFCTKSGKQNSMNYFLMGGDDEVKSAVLSCNKQQWRQIRGEVKTWVLNNWYRWIDEKPLWFTEAWLAKVPTDFIPEDEDQAKLEEIRKKVKRRSSAAKALDVARILPLY